MTPTNVQVKALLGSPTELPNSNIREIDHSLSLSCLLIFIERTAKSPKYFTSCQSMLKTGFDQVSTLLGRDTRTTK